MGSLYAAELEVVSWGDSEFVEELFVEVAVVVGFVAPHSVAFAPFGLVED